MDDITDAAVMYTRLNVGPSTKLPPQCCTCGKATSSTEQIDAQRNLGNEGWLARIAYVIYALASPNNAGHAMERYAASSGERQELRVDLPRCDPCQAKGPLVPVYTSFERGYMTFEVGRRFAEAVLSS